MYYIVWIVTIIGLCIVLLAITVVFNTYNIVNTEHTQAPAENRTLILLRQKANIN